MTERPGTDDDFADLELRLLDARLVQLEANLDRLLLMLRRMDDEDVDVQELAHDLAELAEKAQRLSES